MNFLSQNGTAAQLEGILLGSDEFFALYGNHPNDAFLQMLYQIVLNRPIDSAGAQSWGQALQSGTMSRFTVAAAVLGSVEADSMEVNTLYRHILHRRADPNGLNTYVGLLQKGSSAEQLMVLFLTSSEYVSQI